MREYGKKYLIITGMILVFLFILCPNAFASVDSSFVPDSTVHASDCYTAAKQNFGATAQRKGKAAMQVITGLPQIDASLYSCMLKFDAAFSGVLTISNPLDILKMAAQKALMMILNQACQIAMSAVNSVIASAESLLNLACIPLPPLPGLTGGLNLPKIPCNGVNLLNPKIGPAPPGSPPGYWQLWQRKY